MLNYALQTFVNDVFGAQKEHDFATAANALAETFGYRWFAYFSSVRSKFELLSTYPAFWTDHYAQCGFDTVDPVIAASRADTTPFFWGGKGAVGPTDAEGKRLFDDAAGFGIRSGVTIPLRGPDGQVAAFTFSTNEALSNDNLAGHELLAMIQTCALRFHAHVSSRVQRFMPGQRTRTLTARQQACLASTADGNSAKQTARIVGGAPRTVEHHLDEAKRRLEASTLPQAVAIAFREGLIS